MGAKMALSLFFIGGLLSGCVHDDPPSRPEPKTVCEAVSNLLSNQWATPGQLAAAMEIGRNKGCFGPAQPKTLIVR